MKLQFWGATDDVTGSMTFINLESGTILIDCGLAQGLPETEKINLIPLPVDPKSISAVIITHAHLDHSGYLPRLVKKGFHGPIYCTPATLGLMQIILLDSAKLNDDGFYEEEDVQQTLRQVKTHQWHEKFKILDTQIEFLPASHILGASSVLIEHQSTRLVFSGDLGRDDDPLLPAPEASPVADIIMMESTYGGKKRTGSIENELDRFLSKIAKEGRVGIIASFAVARAQNLLTLIHQYYEKNPEKKVRVIIDSPMMSSANKIYQKFAHLTHHPEKVFEALSHVEAINFQNEWLSLKKKTGPLVIISASGMVSGGRIGRHLQNWHDDQRAILFLPGYQGAGTPGRALLAGHRTLVGMDNSSFEWSGEIWGSEAFSSHADQGELVNWVSSNNKSPKVFLLHGESTSKTILAQKLNEIGIEEVKIPNRGSTYDCTPV